MKPAEAVRLTEAQRVDWLRLIRTENVGPRTFRDLMARYGSASRALAVLPDLARRGGAAAIRIATRAEAQAEIESCARLGARFVGCGEPDFPQALAAIDDVPPLLAVRGEGDVLRRPMVAIVGSRNASASGLAFTDLLARGLAEAGFVVVSGLARGIDAKAHQATLDAGTVAVLAGGHDRIYPPENEPLLRRILERGAAVSEMPLGWQPRGRDFPRRNRIVAGLAHATVIVEAARRSGSLITARLANEQGRDVFAVPGSPLDPRAEGTNDLLKQGASVCTGPEDVITALQSRLAGSPAPGERSGMRDALPRRNGGVQPPATADLFDVALLSPEPHRADDPFDDGQDGETETFVAIGADVGDAVWGMLGPSPIGVDDLARACGRPVRDIQQSLLELELAGRLVRHGGNRVSRA